MRVTRLPRDPGPAAWNRLLPDPPPPERLEHAIAADWLVIGAGFAGLTAARRLRQLHPGEDIVVLEASRVADGPAGRNSGFMIDLPHDLSSSDYGGAVDHDRAQIEDNRQAIAFAQAAQQDYEMPAEALVLSGKTNAAASDGGHQHNVDFANHLSALGEPCEMLDAHQMRQMTGTAFYQSGLYTPGTAMLQPAMYIRGMADGLRHQGVQIFEFSPVLALDRHGTWVARTPKGRVTAPKVVLAVNGHLNSFGKLRGRLMHVFTYASMTRALTPDEVKRLGGQPTWGATPSDPMGSTIRRISGLGGDRIVVRNRFTFDPSMEVSEARIARVGRDHDRSFAARFPMLKGVQMEHRWGGRLCLSWNNVQVVGEIEDQLYSACCQNGLGTARGTLAGILAAELASGIASPALDRALGSAPPRRLPPAPLASIGANLRLRWSERRAGREL